MTKRNNSQAIAQLAQEQAGEECGLLSKPPSLPRNRKHRTPGHQNCVITQCISIFFLCIIPIPFFVLSNYIKRASLVTKTISPLGFRSHFYCRDLIHYPLPYVFNTAPRCSRPVNHLNTSTFPTWGEKNPSLKPFPCPAIKANSLRNDYISLPPIHPSGGYPPPSWKQLFKRSPIPLHASKSYG